MNIPSLEFFVRLLKNLHIDTNIIPADAPTPENLDRGLRKFLRMGEDYKRTFGDIRKSLNHKTIYRIYDSFSCGYIFMLLPDESFLVAGPYLCKNITNQMITETAEKHALPDGIASQLEKYFGNISYIDDEKNLILICNTLGESLWGENSGFDFKEIILSEPSVENYDVESFKRNDDALLSIQALEERYAMEAQMMKAVSCGMPHKIEMIFNNTSNLVFEKRTEDPVRNLKNYLIISNTLMRKAAEQGSVHPFYIDGLSTEFAKKIEQVQSVSEASDMLQEMIRKYCALVRKHAMKNYSPIVQKVVTLIDSDLTADLGLKRLSSLLSVNPSYLSSLFKKETGKTLTEYVSKKRIEYAAYLLRTTNLQIQTVAQHSGIYDVNYFAKMFKKIIGKTPKEFRQASQSR